MEYEENKKLIEAANLLKEHCEKNIREKECDCPFDFGDDGICSIGDLCPDAWEVPKIKRWTPEDVALANVLKAAGVTEICATSSGQRAWRSDDVGHGYLPDSVFKNVFCGEVFRLDDILKEAEE